MNPSLSRWLLVAVSGIAVVILQSCVAGGGAYYGGGVDVTYGADFYEPWGYEYGGWGPGYWVGPPRGGWDQHHHPGDRPRPYRPVERSAPSIPNRRR
jgi:hypothetical protein